MSQRRIIVLGAIALVLAAVFFALLLPNPVPV